MSKRKKNTKSRKRPPVKAGVVVGIAWYRREEWPKLLAASADRDQLEDTYDEWVSGVEETLSRLSAEGIHAEKVDIDMDKLIAWCREKQVPLDGNARAKYASVMLEARNLDV
jgi:hypothetical protein